MPPVAHPTGIPGLAVAFFKRYWMLLQEVFDVSVVAPAQLSLEGCAKIFNEKNKEKQTSKVVFGISSSGRKGGFIENWILLDI